MLSSQFSNIRRMQFDQTSQVQPLSEIQKSQKTSKNHFFFYFFFAFFFLLYKKNKSYPLSFRILGGRDSTRAIQSTRFRIQGG